MFFSALNLIVPLKFDHLDVLQSSKCVFAVSILRSNMKAWRTIGFPPRMFPQGARRLRRPLPLPWFLPPTVTAPPPHRPRMRLTRGEPDGGGYVSGDGLQTRPRAC